MTKNIDLHPFQPYTKIVRWDSNDNIFTARVEELPGCSAHGQSEEEALGNLRKSMQVWISDALDSGDSIPGPTLEVELPSGKWVQRVPRSLHLKLILFAKSEGVSLNQLVTSALAEAVGKKTAIQTAATQLQQQPSWQATNWQWMPPSFGSHNYMFWYDDSPTDSMSPAFTLLVNKLASGVLGAAQHQPTTGYERSINAKAKKAALTAGS